MSKMEPFTMVERTAGSGPHHLFDDVVHQRSAKTADEDLQYLTALRENNPGMIVTCIPVTNVSLRAFAAAGHATCDLDTKTDSFASMRGYLPPEKRSEDGSLAESVSFAKYHFRWSKEDFILYFVGPYYQYVLKECQEGEHVLGSSKVTDRLIRTIGEWMRSMNKVVWVYDGYWQQSTKLYEQVMKSGWDKVILDESKKKELTSVTNKFFASKDVYDDLGVPWKRGLLFHGPPGNGKTISIRALMKGLYDREDPIPTLYVKSAPYTYDIRMVFTQARALAPCMLILEDVETIVTSETRSYFFNEMDGLENNDGLFIVGSTNFLDKLDPGLSKRPSRFDRKYKFPLPDEHERTLYCEYWRNKLKNNDDIEFPEKLCPAMATITDGFSFAFLQECFVATLLVLARQDDEDEDEDSDNWSQSTQSYGEMWRGPGWAQPSRIPMPAQPYDSDNDDLDDYRLWVAFKEQADILRKEVESQKSKSSQLAQWLKPHDGLGEGPSQPPVERRRQQMEDTQRSCSCTANDLHRRQKRMEKERFEAKARDPFYPDLPWYEQKSAFINSAATEWKI